MQINFFDIFNTIYFFKFLLYLEVLRCRSIQNFGFGVYFGCMCKVSLRESCKLYGSSVQGLYALWSTLIREVRVAGNMNSTESKFEKFRKKNVHHILFCPALSNVIKRDIFITSPCPLTWLMDAPLEPLQNAISLHLIFCFLVNSSFHHSELSRVLSIFYNSIWQPYLVSHLKFLFSDFRFVISYPKNQRIPNCTKKYIVKTTFWVAS